MMISIGVVSPLQIKPFFMMNDHLYFNLYEEGEECPDPIKILHFEDEV